MQLSRACAAAVAASLATAAVEAQTTEPNTRTEATSTGYEIRINSQGTTIQRAVVAPADSVWALLPEVFRELGITPQIVGDGGRTMGNQRITARRVAGERTDRFVRCGNQGSGASAVSALRIQLSVITTLEPIEQLGTRLHTEVAGTAHPVEGSGGVMHCTSTGLLEQKLGAAVAERIRRR